MRTEISSKTRIQNPIDAVQTELHPANPHRVLHLEELKMSGKLGAKLALDGAVFATGDRFEGFDAGVEVRRARIYAKGDCLLILPISYQLELGYIPHEFYIEESYLAFRDLRFIGQLKFGQFQAPMGLDVVASSRDISFMEPAAPLQALTPGVNAGVAWVNGPFSIQGEFLHSFVQQSEADTLSFQGFYGSASWFFTGESRPYNRENGCFARVIPKRNFNWGGGGWGAWEITGCYSFVDLDSGSIDGGRLGMIMAGLNWYLHSHVKCRFNYGLGRVDDRDPEGRLRVFQTRVEVDL